MLLRGRSCYVGDEINANLATYQCGKVSLPESVVGSPLVTSVAGELDRDYLECYEQRMLKPADEAERIKADGMRPKP